MVKIGCCGFPVARGRYFENFDIVEIQKTFYDFVNSKLLGKWRDQAPEHFEFVLKAPQFITHSAKSPTYRRVRIRLDMKLNAFGDFQPTKEVFNAYEAVYNYARILRTRIIIFQTPPSFTPEKKNLKNMERFFNEIERGNLILGWESRGRWGPSEIREVCKKFDLVDVVDPFLRRPVTGNLFYFRLHGGKGYRHKFSEDELRWLARIIKKDGYVMFNNISMFFDAQRFKSLF